MKMTRTRLPSSARSTSATGPPLSASTRSGPTWKTPSRPAPSDDESPPAVSVGGVIELFRGRPRDPIGEGGRMSLGDHFRELRARVMRITLVVVIGSVVAFFFYDQLFELI